jgi:hypothetical protein
MLAKELHARREYQMIAKHGFSSMIVLVTISGGLLHAADMVITVAGGGSSTDEGIPATRSLSG